MLAISDKYALPLPLAMLALVEEITKTSKVSKVFILRTISLRNLLVKSTN